MAPESLQERGGRKYRSKKQRPCDLCRSRKTQCRMLDTNSNCELCKKLNRQCTFVLQPLRKEQRPRSATTGLDGHLTNEMHPNLGDSLRDSDINHISQIHDDDSNTAVDLSSFWLQSPPNNDSSFVAQTTPQLLSNMWSGQSSLDRGRNQPNPATLDDGVFLPDAVPSLDNLPHPHFQSSIEANMTSPMEATTLALANDTSTEHDAEASSQQFWENGFNGSEPFDWPNEFSLDTRQGYSSQLIGLSNESDPYLLRHYLYNVHDTYPMFRLDFRKVVEDSTIQAFADTQNSTQSNLPVDDMPIQFVMIDETICQEDLRAVDTMFSHASTEVADIELLHKLVPADLGAKLLTLYSKFVHPQYPVIDLQDFRQEPHKNCFPEYPVGITTAVYALAAPFTYMDDELSVSKAYLQMPTEELWAIAHRSFQRSTRFAHLSSLQLCLLLLQMPPQNFAVGESSHSWALSCSALAIAESLGLNLDPTDWRLPRKEMGLRRRLWWLTYVQHIWQALVLGRPSHLNDDNWDVSKLNAEDLPQEENMHTEIRQLVQRQSLNIVAMSDLSMIAADVLKDFYSIRAAREATTSTILLERAHKLRTRIEKWRDGSPFLEKQVSDLNDEELEQNAALRLSHLTLEILILRALLRPLVYQSTSISDSSQEPNSTIFESSFICAKAAVDMVSALKPRHFANSWPSCTRYLLCNISSFILLNFAQSTSNDMAIRNKDLLFKWRNTLRTQARAWPLAKLATVRLDAVFWKGLTVAVQGSGPNSPAMMLLKEQET